jgi:hypothetical protein
MDFSSCGVNVIRPGNTSKERIVIGILISIYAFVLILVMINLLYSFRAKSRKRFPYIERLLMIMLITIYCRGAYLIDSMPILLSGPSKSWSFLYKSIRTFKFLESISFCFSLLITLYASTIWMDL